MLKAALIVTMSLAALLLPCGNAFGATTPTLVRDRVEVGEVTTVAVTKAQSDVQIRRIKNLLVNRRSKNSEAAFKKLEKLQKSLRGEK
jgi:hypothetical protein